MTHIFAFLVGGLFSYLVIKLYEFYKIEEYKFDKWTINHWDSHMTKNCHILSAVSKTGNYIFCELKSNGDLETIMYERSN